jgi:NAD(P)H-flavin reductase
MEGPYGAHHDLSSFDHVLLVAGGSGVTAIAPHVRALANTETDVTVVWAAPDSHYAADILSNELANTFASIYLTREKDHPDPDHLCGRPDVDDIVAKAVANIQGNERLAVLACGPGSMMDDLRAAVVASYGTVQGHQIEYFEEAFTW